MDQKSASARGSLRAIFGAAAFVLCALTVAPRASAADADPVELRRWLCTFFNASHDARPALLGEAPVTYAPGSALRHERRDVGTQGGLVDVWTIGRQSSFWQTSYRRGGRAGRPNNYFGLEVNGDRGLLLADDASVRAFFVGFPEPTIADDEYTFRIVDPDEPNDEVFDRFVIIFDIRSQDMSIRWSREAYQSYGQNFCQR